MQQKQQQRWQHENSSFYAKNFAINLLNFKTI